MSSEIRNLYFKADEWGDKETKAVNAREGDVTIYADKKYVAVAIPASQINGRLRLDCKQIPAAGNDLIVTPYETLRKQLKQSHPRRFFRR